MVIDIATLIAGGESSSVELKTSLSDTRRIIETIAAMATSSGGHIIVGVRDNGEVVGAAVGKGESERLVQQILANTDPRIFVDVSRQSLGGKTVLLIAVPPSDGPHLAFGRAFFRSGPATVAMTRDEYERRLLDRLRESGGYERRRATSVTLDNLDPRKMDRFLELAQGRLREAPRMGHPKELLQRLHLLSDGIPTVASVLLFGKHPSDAFPQAVIQCRARRGTGDDSARIEGGLFEQIDDAVRFVERNLRTHVDRGSVRRKEKKELPVEAVREIIANAVAHRDYRSTAPTQVLLDDKQLDVWNGGALPSPLTPSALRQPHPSIPTNPLIARALFLAGYIEEWGTGTTRVIDAMKANGNSEPLYIAEDAGFRVILPIGKSISALIPERERSVLAKVTRGKPIASRDYAEIAGVSLRTAITDLTRLEQMGLISRVGRGKQTRWVKS